MSEPADGTPDRGAVWMLTSTLDQSAEEENQYRYDIAPYRDAARAAIAALLRRDTSNVLPPSLEEAANRLEPLIRNFPSSKEALPSALAQFRSEVIATLLLDGGLDVDSVLGAGGAAAQEAKEARDESQSAANEIAGLLEQSRKLVGAAADDKLAAHYRSRADDETTAANTWRRRTLWGFAGTVGFSLVTTVLALVDEPHWERILGTGSLSVAIGALTTYLGAQATLHRRRETAYRRAELKLAVVTPMLESIAPQQRDQARADVIKLVFATEPIEDA